MKGKFTTTLSLVLVVVMVSIMVSASACQKEDSAHSSEDETTSKNDFLEKYADVFEDIFEDDSITLDMLNDYTGITFPEGSEVGDAVRYIYKNRPYCVLEGSIMVEITVPYEGKDLLYETLKNASDRVSNDSSEEKIFAGMPNKSDKTYAQADRTYVGFKHIDSDNADEYQIFSFVVYTFEDEDVIRVYLSVQESLIR